MNYQNEKKTPKNDFEKTHQTHVQNAAIFICT